MEDAIATLGSLSALCQSRAGWSLFHDAVSGAKARRQIASLAKHHATGRDSRLQDPMQYDLNSMFRKELEKLKSNIDKALERVAKKELKEALAAAEKAVKAYGLSLAEITGGAGALEKLARKAAKKPKNAGAPKYANPENKTQTWTGKGRQPEWFKEAMAVGKAPEQLEI